MPWAQLKQLIQQLQAVQPDEPGLQLHTVCRGSQLVLQPPQARQKSPELQARLATLQAALDQQHYDRMVHDVTEKVSGTQLSLQSTTESRFGSACVAFTLKNLIRLLLAFPLLCDLQHITKAADERAVKCSICCTAGVQERAAATAAEGVFRSFKDQLAFGIHVLVMMGTFYALGHVAGRGLSPKTSVVGSTKRCCPLLFALSIGAVLVIRHSSLLQHAACGLVGLVLALLLESVLVIIRTTHPPSLEKYRHLQDGFQAPAASVLQQQQPPSGLLKKRQ